QYQYTDVPQPSQPIPQLRQTRLQQLREERMRRQQRRMQPDITTVVQSKGKTGKRSLDGAPPSQQPVGPQQMSPSWGTGAPPSMMVGSPSAPPLPPTQMSPVLPLPPTEISPIRSSTVPPGSLQHSPIEFSASVGPLPQPTAAP